MLPILPPEILITILESTTFQASDLASIALSTKGFVHFARKTLYRQLLVDPCGGCRLTPVQGSGAATYCPRIYPKQRVVEDFSHLRRYVLQITVHGFSRVEFLPQEEGDIMEQRLGWRILTQLSSILPNLERFYFEDWQCFHKIDDFVSSWMSRQELLRPPRKIELYVSTSTGGFAPRRDPFTWSFTSFKKNDNYLPQILLSASRFFLQCLGVKWEPSIDLELFPNLKHLRLFGIVFDLIPLTRSVYSCKALEILELDFIIHHRTGVDVLRDALAADQFFPPRLTSLSFGSGTNFDYMAISDFIIAVLPPHLQLRWISLSGLGRKPYGKAETQALCRARGIEIVENAKWPFCDLIFPARDFVERFDRPDGPAF